jgi:hypothetical protein
LSIVGEGLGEAVAFEGGLLAIEAPAFDDFVGEQESEVSANVSRTNWRLLRPPALSQSWAMAA